jgi:hypothetical protein
MAPIFVTLLVVIAVIGSVHTIAATYGTTGTSLPIEGVEREYLRKCPSNRRNRIAPRWIAHSASRSSLITYLRTNNMPR